MEQTSDYGKALMRLMAFLRERPIGEDTIHALRSTRDPEMWVDDYIETVSADAQIERMKDKQKNPCYHDWTVDDNNRDCERVNHNLDKYKY
jgi:hypothetical protein